MLLRLFVFAVLMLDGWSRLNPEPREFAVLELNHRFDEFGTHCFDQIIVWEWVPAHRRYDVVCWWLVDPVSLDRLPAKRGSKWQIVKQVENRRILFRSAIYRETWTNTDPERENQQVRAVSTRSPVW